MTIAFRCDANHRAGVGHFTRCFALAQEIQRRGEEVCFLGDLGGLDWAQQQLTQHGFRLLPGFNTPAEAAAAAANGYRAVVLDSYTIDRACSGVFLDHQIPALTIVDGDTRGQQASLYLDQNYDATLQGVPRPTRLAGVQYALLRPSVVNQRPAAPFNSSSTEPDVLAFFGGTDAANAAPAVASLMIATGMPWHAKFVTPTEATRDALSALVRRPNQRLTMIQPTPQLATDMAATDLIITTCGSATYETMCLGKPAALVTVAPNQVGVYDKLVAAEAAFGLGPIQDLKGAAAPAAPLDTLRAIFADPERRNAVARTAYNLVDGGGWQRVANRLMALLAS